MASPEIERTARVLIRQLGPKAQVSAKRIAQRFAQRGQPREEFIWREITDAIELHNQLRMLMK